MKLVSYFSKQKLRCQLFYKYELDKRWKGIMSVETLTSDAQAAFDSGDYQQAVDLYEAAYQLEQTVALNMAFVKSLDAAEQYAQAYRIATELPWSAYKTEESQVRFIRVALHAGQPISAHKMLVKFNSDSHELEELISQTEQILRDEQAVKIKTMTREFYHLGEATLTEQQQRLQEYDQLPLDEYVFGAKGILTDPFAHPLTRATVFASLQQLNIADAIDMLSVLGEVQAVKPNDFTSLQEMTVYKAVQKLLIEQEPQMDPVMWQGIAQQTELMLQIMYPFLDDGIDQVDDWVANLQAMMMGELTAKMDTKQGEWQQATIQAMTEILGF